MPRIDDPALSALCDTIRHNCAISDARYARNYSLCIYLLRMREYYRWQHDLPLQQSLDVTNVGDWVTDRESNWDDIEENDFTALPIGAQHYSPFDTDAINQVLQPHGLVYTAGLGRMGQPHFLLASLRGHTRHDGIAFYDCGTEYARDSITIPAMSQNGRIFIRHDSIRRQFWQMLEEWRLHRHAGAMQRLVSRYALDTETQHDDRGLDAAARDLALVIRAHEQGEVLAGRELGDAYAALVHTTLGQPAEYLLRSLRDLLADSLHTLPSIRDSANPALLDLWLAGLNGVREKWLTTTGTVAQLEAADSDEARLSRLATLCEQERERWQRVAGIVLSTAASDAEPASRNTTPPDIAALIEEAIS